MSRKIWISCLLAATTIFSNFASAQITVESNTKSAVPDSKKTAVTQVETVELDADGNLTGTVYLNQAGEQKPAAAKLTLTADGVVINSIVADEEGNFAFANVEPGTYQMYGSADGYSGSSMVDAASYSGGVSEDYSMGLDSYSSDAVYDNYSGAPVQSFGSATCGGGGCGASSCGGGAGGGGGLRRKLLWAGIGLGIVGIAGGFDGKEPASP